MLIRLGDDVANVISNTLVFIFNSSQLSSLVHHHVSQYFRKHNYFVAFAVIRRVAVRKIC